MLVIRLFRTGKKKQAFFKIVVTDKRRPPKGGRFVEQVGILNPITKEKALKAERIKHWLSIGAKPSASVYNMLVSAKIVEGKKLAKHAKAKKKEEAAKVPEKAAKPAAAKTAPAAEVKPEEKKPAQPAAEVKTETTEVKSDVPKE